MPNREEPISEISLDTLFDDIGLWPQSINPEIRGLLIRRGSSVVQQMDSDFETAEWSDLSAKGTLRSLTRN